MYAGIYFCRTMRIKHRTKSVITRRWLKRETHRRRFPSNKPGFAGLMDAARKTLWLAMALTFTREIFNTWHLNQCINPAQIPVVSRDSSFLQKILIINPFYQKQCNNIIPLKKSWYIYNRSILNFHIFRNSLHSIMAIKIGNFTLQFSGRKLFKIFTLIIWI